MQGDCMIKPGVSLKKLTPQMAVAYTIACFVYYKHTGTWTKITSGDDSVHGKNSLHPAGKALDLHTNTLRPSQVHPIFTELATALGDEYDVVLEADHIHVEYDPK
jgi:hypothetical protein